MYSGYATTSSLPFCPKIFFGMAANGPKSNATAVSPRDAVYALLKRDLKTNLVKKKIKMSSNRRWDGSVVNQQRIPKTMIIKNVKQHWKILIKLSEEGHTII